MNDRISQPVPLLMLAAWQPLCNALYLHRLLNLSDAARSAVVKSLHAHLISKPLLKIPVLGEK